MTKLDTLVERVSRLPADRRDEVAEAFTQLLDLAWPPTDVPAWHLEELARRMAGPDDYATDEEVEAFFARLDA